MSNLEACDSPLINALEFRTFQNLLQKHCTSHALQATGRVTSGWARLLLFHTFPRELMEMHCTKQAPWDPQGSHEACADQIHIEERLHQEGFLHWNDSFAANSLKTLQGLSNFPMGLGILRSILASAQLRDFLQKWFAPNKGPYIIGHCFHYSDVGTGGLPLFLRQKTYQNDRCLGLHILTADTTVRYFAGSHRENWAQTGLHWFQNSLEALGNHRSEPRSNGL